MNDVTGDCVTGGGGGVMSGDGVRVGEGGVMARGSVMRKTVGVRIHCIPPLPAFNNLLIRTPGNQHNNNTSGNTYNATTPSAFAEMIQFMMMRLGMEMHQQRQEREEAEER